MAVNDDTNKKIINNENNISEIHINFASSTKVVYTDTISYEKLFLE